MDKSIAGWHVTSRGHVGDQEQKHFSPLGTKLYFHVNFSSKISIVLTPNMAALATKTTEHSKIFQCNSICWFNRHIIIVFLLNQCLSSYCTVFYLKNDSLLMLRILRFPGYFETPLFRTFFHFPWDFEIAAFDCFPSLIHRKPKLTLREGVLTNCELVCLAGVKMKEGRGRERELSLPLSFRTPDTQANSEPANQASHASHR